MAESLPELSALVLTALEKAVQQDGECRLVAKGKGHAGLFEGGRATAAKTEAQAQCVDPALGLFAAREVSEGKGKTAATAWFVTPTPAGVDALFARLPAGRRAELRLSCAEAHRPTVDAAVLRAVADEMGKLDVERERLDRQASELRDLLKRVADEQLAAIDQTRSRLDRQRADLEALRPPSPPPIGDQKPPRKPDTGPQQEPADDADLDFQRNLCRELVYVWRDTPEPDARAALEAVMINSGALEPAAEADEEVLFDGMEHTSADDLMPGDPAVVVAPGWRYVSRKGSLLFAKSRVRAGGGEP